MMTKPMDIIVAAMLFILAIAAIGAGLYALGVSPAKSVTLQAKRIDLLPEGKRNGQRFIQFNTAYWGGDTSDWWLKVMGSDKGGIYSIRETTIQSKANPIVSEKDGIWYITFEPKTTNE